MYELHFRSNVEIRSSHKPAEHINITDLPMRMDRTQVF
jgi:hypothetical protein